MKKNSFLVKTVLMSMLTAVTFSFASCSQDDDLLTENNSGVETEQALTRSAANCEELAVDVANVKYQVTNDQEAGPVDVLRNFVNGSECDPDVEAYVNQLRSEAEQQQRGAMTRTATPKATWGYRYIDFNYESIDEQGKPVTLSARVCWGMDIMGREISPKYMALCPHSTIAADYETPTRNASLENALLQGDRLLIMPDYLGYGASKDRVHPYINHDLCTRNSIDALKAGYKVFADMSKVPMHPDWRLYVTGCSQGGANALAIHKWLDTHLDFAQRWRFEYSYCACGPYSPVVTFQEYFKQKKLDYPIVLPLTLKAMFAAYPEILGKWKEEDFYSEAYLKHKSVVDYMISSKEYASGPINKEICKIFPHKGEAGIKDGEQIWLTDILNPEVINPESAMSKALFECLDKNDLTKGWKPVHPIHLYHGKNDTYVGFANSEAVMAAFPDMATLDISMAGTDGHLMTCIKWMSNVRIGNW